LHSARSTTFWLLSLGTAFALLAWSAQRSLVPSGGGETTCATYTWGGAMHPAVTVSPCVASGAGQAWLRRLP
jgi:hypothetical protein